MLSETRSSKTATTFAMGVHLLGTVNNVVHRRVTMKKRCATKERFRLFGTLMGLLPDWGTSQHYL